MNDLDEVHDDVLNTVRDFFRELVVSACPSPDGIIASGHARRRRRRLTVAAAGLSTVALGALVVPTLTSADKPAAMSTAPRATVPRASALPTRLAAFDVVNNADGTKTYTLSSGLLSENAAALTATLAQHGIPAIVRQGSFCSSNPAPAEIAQILVPAPDAGSGTAADRKAVAIDPSAMPAGTALSIGLSSTDGNTAVHLALVNANDYTCTGMPSLGANSADQPANKQSNGTDSNRVVHNSEGNKP